MEIVLQISSTLECYNLWKLLLTSGRAKEMSSYNQEQKSTFKWHDGAESLGEIWKQGRPASQVQLPVLNERHD